MEKKKVVFKDKVVETMLIPLYMRAQESRRAAEGKDCILRDEVAESVVGSLDYDFSRLDAASRSKVGCVVRGWYFDRAVSRFVSSHGGAVVVNVGCGLDTRYQRAVRGTGATYYDLDLPEAMELRRQLIPDEEGDNCISASLLETGWMDELRERHPGSPFVFVFEGVLMYFEEGQIRDVLRNIASRFEGEVWFDLVGPALAGRMKPDGLESYEAQVRSGIADARDIEAWGVGLRLIEQANYMQFFRNRWGFVQGHILGRLNKLCFRFSSLTGFRTEG